MKLVGQSVVDFHRIYRSEKKTQNRALCGQLMDDDATVAKSSDLLIGKMVKRERNGIYPSKNQ
jgi:hypothetical protein